jgi:glutamate N-acetyltransferase/amino-acid N-acetyltransferase
MSTGVIGQPLKMDKIQNGISLLTGPNGMSGDHEGWLKAAVGIMTTDTFPKLRSKEFKTSNGATYRMAGWCKGAGMIHPNMATMLSAVYTDAPVSSVCLDKALKHSVERSFNAISVDGDTSTNDTLVVLANGAAEGVKPISDVNSQEYKDFEANLTSFASELAQLIVRDGEGATKFVDIRVEVKYLIVLFHDHLPCNLTSYVCLMPVQGARSFEEAKEIASTISKSPLVKTAIYGKDANWGRIVCAVGYSGIPIEPSKVNLHFETGDGSIKLHLFKNGAPFDVNEDVAAKILAGEDIVIRVNLGLGKESAQMFTCDFSHEYISINADCKFYSHSFYL